jgi:hypothetical protein
MATLCVCTNSDSNTLLVFIMCTVVAHVKDMCHASGPATVKESLCSATVAAAQPFSVLYGRFHTIQQPSSCWQLRVWQLSGPFENDLKPHLTLVTGQGQPHLTHRTYSTQQSLSWEANQLQLAKKFPTFYGTRQFLTTFTRAHHFSLPWAISVREQLLITTGITPFHFMTTFSANLNKCPVN